MLNIDYLSEFQSTPPVREATYMLKDGELVEAFQSTPPVGEATNQIKALYEKDWISIHASRGGGDTVHQGNLPHNLYFNPRLPWGRRQQPGH